jgi:Secretion system C-terminal sorting domain
VIICYNVNEGLDKAMEIRIFPSFDMERDGNLIGQIRPCTMNKQAISEEAIFLPNNSDLADVFPDTFLNAAIASEANTSDLSSDMPLLFPNPTNGVSNVYGTNVGDTICVRDQLGRLILMVPSSGSKEVQLPIQNLTSGIYFVSVYRGTQALAFWKLVVQK